MSNHALQTNDNDLKSTRPNQSMWMNRWTTTNSNSTLRVHNQCALHDVNKGKDFDLEEGDKLAQVSEPTIRKRLDISATQCDISKNNKSGICQQVVASSTPQYSKAVEVVTEAKRVEIRYETLVTDSRNIRNSRLEPQTISTVNFGEKIGSILSQKRFAVSIEHESTTQTDDIFRYGTNVEPSNSHFLFRSPRSAPVETATQMEAWHSRPESTLQCERQSAKPYASLDKNRPYNGEPGDRTHTFTSTQLSLGHSCTEQGGRAEKFNKGCHSSSDGLQPVHQRDELRLFSSVGSGEGVSRSPMFSPATNHFSIIDVSKGHQIAKTSTISTKLKEVASQKRFTLLPGFDYQNDCNKNLLPLISSQSTGGNKAEKDERNVFLASKDESSANTDTMDINVCRTWNSFPSITSSPSCKALQDPMGSKKPILSHSIILRDNIGNRKTLPDMNKEPPPNLAAEEEIDNMDLSTSRTESLDVEHLVQVDHSGNSNSSSQSLALSSDPSSRWVKRLKLSSSDNHAHATKNVWIGDSSFTAKGDMPHNKGTMLRPSFSKLFRDGQMELDKISLSPGDNEAASMDLMKEDWGLNLSHPWIQRWCHNQTRQSRIKQAPAVASELDISKTTSDEYQTKQFPSIAAMALMGKTMNGLQACKFQNKGSFVIWGSGGF